MKKNTTMAAQWRRAFQNAGPDDNPWQDCHEVDFEASDRMTRGEGHPVGTGYDSVVFLDGSRLRYAGDDKGFELG